MTTGLLTGTPIMIIISGGMIALTKDRKTTTMKMKKRTFMIERLTHSRKHGKATMKTEIMTMLKIQEDTIMAGNRLQDLVTMLKILKRNATVSNSITPTITAPGQKGGTIMAGIGLTGPWTNPLVREWKTTIMECTRGE